MTNKQRILHMVEKWPDDIPFERAIYHMEVLKAVLESLNEPGEATEHEELFRQLLDDGEENQNHVATKSEKKPGRNQGTHRPGRAKNGNQLHSTPQRGRKGA